MQLQATATGVLDIIAVAVGILNRPLRPEGLVETAKRRLSLHSGIEPEAHSAALALAAMPVRDVS